MNKEVKIKMRKSLYIIVSIILLGILTNFVKGSTLQHTVTISTTFGGTTNPEPSTYFYEHGENVTILAIPSEGCNFSYWIIEKYDVKYNTTENPLTLIVDSDMNITAIFSYDVLSFLQNLRLIEVVILIGDFVGSIIGVTNYPLTLGTLIIMLAILYAPYLLIFFVRFKLRR